ncbi:uncharacterized protein LOC122062027 [Macadamia integrifolia]|uniref:uncharacterized protein LOC122062027 n=1 Tax=Macadamia integrifolia TaxID=60698 RepID=UPI001C533AC6|nr:uncharacterized protein LOC122062027 [Macadamia integrifolia]XP_042481594.1 uncharacterized protein LOC122062027 [Macadamia integrifolia]XP_042481595.1 uncharacterized protein LOC122062027 [Macadamia integrifolia]
MRAEESLEMDPAGLEAVVPTRVNSEKSLPSVGDKRPLENEDDVDNGGRLHKKAKGDLNMDMKKVAEIVLVLSAMGKMRGGRNPTDVEGRLMAEARQKLAEACEALAPKDILSSTAVKAVIEDIGLNNRLKDQRLGFRPPKMSITDRLLLTKRKMEESKGFSGQSRTYSSQLSQVGFGATVESRAPLLPAAHMFPPEKPCPTPVSVGVFQSAPPMVHVSALSSTSSMNQLAVSEVKPAVVPRGLPSSSVEKDSSSLTMPRTEAAHFRLDGRLNGPAFGSQVRENTSSDHQLEKAPRLGQTNKVSDLTPTKTEGSSNLSNPQVAFQAAKDQSSKSSVIQTVSGSLPSVQQPSHGINFIQNPSPFNNHNDIARNVQKFLHPRLPEHPNWIPPSVEYMNKALTCQICKATISDVESLLVCDACEKGVHLKCLQSYNQKGIPKGEWHCPKCIISSNGKPLPPKYGRVTRNNTAPKVSLNTNGGLISAVKKVENSDQKINHQKAIANGNPGILNPAVVGGTGSNHIESSHGLKITSVIEAQGSDFTISRVGPEKSRESAGNSDPPIQSCGTVGSNSDFTSLPKFERGHHYQASCNSLDYDKKGPLYHEASGNQDIVNSSTPKELGKSDLRETSECKSSCEIRQENQDLPQAGSTKASDSGNVARDCNRSSLDDLRDVDWVGDIVRIVDEKSFYQSCRVNGAVYKLQDHALFCSSNDNLRPSKIQALWEDNKTRSKWAIVNRCYLPSDLPKVVGRPCTPENNEVYESNHDSTVMAGLIQGPCQVLPPNKFKEESERRSHLLHGENDGLQTVFLCKWFYDESKGLFRTVTD